MSIPELCPAIASLPPTHPLTPLLDALEIDLGPHDVITKHSGSGHVVLAHLSYFECKPDIIAKAAADSICTVNRQRLSY